MSNHNHEFSSFPAIAITPFKHVIFNYRLWSWIQSISYDYNWASYREVVKFYSHNRESSSFFLITFAKCPEEPEIMIYDHDCKKGLISMIMIARLNPKPLKQHFFTIETHLFKPISLQNGNIMTRINLSASLTLLTTFSRA